MANYSGRTTAYKHKHTKWVKDAPYYKGCGKNSEDITVDYEKIPEYLTDGKLDWGKIPHNAKSAIQNTIIFEVQWSDCPVEVSDEVGELWQDKEFGNDYCYYSWRMGEDAESYPIIAEYLKSKGIENCLIHYWW